MNNTSGVLISKLEWSLFVKIASLLLALRI